LQSEQLNKLVRSAIDAGKVDAIIQSTDKCFLTPVGGAVILSPVKEIIQACSQVYAGRASATPVLHLLVSLLALGKQGYLQLMRQQQENRKLLGLLLQEFATKISEHIIDCKNPVSCAMSLKHLNQNQINNLGGYLYNLRVTGPRVVNPHKKIFGTCTSEGEMPYPYVVLNAAIGVKAEHIKQAIFLLEKALTQIQEKF
jgi:O-phospho-L-seryl-tRNASec:L-selenocysteinyl-tRNA synthase